MLAIVSLTCRLLMQRQANVVETPWHRKVRRPYIVRWQYILHDKPVFKMIRHSIASDTLWIRKVRHRYAVVTLNTSQVRDRYTYCVAVAYDAVNLRSYYVHAAVFLFVHYIRVT